jgi:predicted dehydrogenase
MTRPGSSNDKSVTSPANKASLSSEKAPSEALPAYAAPKLPYEPQDPPGYRPAIAMVGCGAITIEHLRVYRKAGYNVVALCDMLKERAEARRAEFFPEADVYTSVRDVVARDDVEVVDITTHPEDRVPLIEAALLAKKHVLSQKPFVENLDVGERLCDLAEKQGVLLAVNQNGRWAPHFSYMRLAIEAGLIGEVSAAHLAVHWDHGWVKTTPFNKIRHLILYDFGIHWFDIMQCFLAGQRPTRVYASFTRSRSQEADPALLAQVQIEYDQAQGSLVFDGDTRFGTWDTTYITGSLGTLKSSGPVIKNQEVELYTEKGVARPTLEGRWFPDGFHGSMAELLSAIAGRRAPIHNARDNLQSLALCYAAVASAEAQGPRVPGSVRSMPK